MQHTADQPAPTPASVAWEAAVGRAPASGSVLVIGAGATSAAIRMARNGDEVTLLVATQTAAEAGRQQLDEFPHAVRSRLTLRHDELAALPASGQFSQIIEVLDDAGGWCMPDPRIRHARLEAGGRYRIVIPLAPEGLGGDPMDAGRESWSLLAGYFDQIAIDTVAGAVVIASQRRHEPIENGEAAEPPAQVDDLLTIFAAALHRGLSMMLRQRLTSNERDAQRLRAQLEGAVAARNTYDVQLRHAIGDRSAVEKRLEDLKRQAEVWQRQVQSLTEELASIRKDKDQQIQELRQQSRRLEERGKTLGLAAPRVDLLKHGEVRAGAARGKLPRIVVLEHSADEVAFHLEASDPRAGDFAELTVPLTLPPRKAARWVTSLWVHSPYSSDKVSGNIAWQVLVDGKPVLEEDCSSWPHKSLIRVFLAGRDTPYRLTVRTLAVVNCKPWSFGRAGRLHVSDIRHEPIEGGPTSAVTSTSPYAVVMVQPTSAR